MAGPESPHLAVEAHIEGLPAFDSGNTHREDSDEDSTYDTFIGDDTRTLSTFITSYRFENGRRYHAYQDGAYWGPNDEHARDVQDLTHHLFLLTLDNKLHLAPLDNPERVLDVGCGTGSWAIDYADENPDTEVIGNDLSPIQPDFIPSNCSFEVDDVTQLWTHPDDHFDFIHVREMFGSIPDWEFFFEQAFRHTAPGGWIEIVEHAVAPRFDDESSSKDHFFAGWGQTMEDCGRAMGKTFSIWKESKQRIKDAGFVDVREFRFKWPIGAWCKDAKLKEIGKWNQLRIYDGAEGMALRLLTVTLEWPFDKAQAYLNAMREKVMTDYDVHAYIEGSIVYGRKPQVS